MSAFGMIGAKIPKDTVWLKIARNRATRKLILKLGIFLQLLKNKFFSWIYEDWKPCSCNGTQLQNSVCVESVRKRIVQNDKCDLDTRPRPNRRQCDDFDVTWITKNWSSCSATCGYGHRNRRVYCVCKSTNTRVENQKCARNSTRPPPTEICYRDNCMGDVSNDIFLNSRMGGKWSLSQELYTESH